MTLFRMKECMRAQDFPGKNLESIISEINYDINLLYVSPCIYTRNIILNHLKHRVSMLEASMKIMEQAAPLNQVSFSLQELSKFNGKDGNPAYVAVNGTVYDVTNNAAWAAAAHFGLTAGKDLTNEFAACHAGQPILSKLKVVGKLVRNE